MSPELRDMVLEMIGGPIPVKLGASLQRIDEMCQSAGGFLRSRQLIAMYIEWWRLTTGDSE